MTQSSERRIERDARLACWGFRGRAMVVEWSLRRTQAPQNRYWLYNARRWGRALGKDPRTCIWYSSFAFKTFGDGALK